MSNRFKLRQSTEASKVPLLSDLYIGEIGYNVADNKLYISDGVNVLQINHANYLTQDATHRLVTDTQISDWTGKQDNLGYTPVDVAGDTMTGPLILSGAPQVANEAATKQYTDDGLATKLSLAGGTMSGALVLAADPVQNLEPATKQYTDSAVNAVSGKYAAPVQDLIELAAVTAYTDKQMRLVEDTGAIFRFDSQATDAASTGSVLIPDDLTVSDPGRWIKVQAATQSHNLLNGLQGGAAGDYLHLTTAEKNGYDAHLVDAGLHLTSEQNTWLDAINASSTEVNYLMGVTSSVQTQIDSKQANLGFTPVNVAGDTMTGLLILSGPAVEANGAVTLNQLQNFVIDGGTF